MMKLPTKEEVDSGYNNYLSGVNDPKYIRRGGDRKIDGQRHIFMFDLRGHKHLIATGLLLLQKYGYSAKNIGGYLFARRKVNGR